MSAQSKQAADASRALFMFSGHGLEVTQEKQILLPKDYLAPPSPSLNDAISTKNLELGLASHAVSDQLFFIDACRNDHRELRKKKIEGAAILNEDISAVSNPKRNAPIIYASGSGDQAFQPREATQGPSLFGRALVEGLTAQTAIELDCNAGRCDIRVSPLLASLRTRVNELAQLLGHHGILNVPVGGSQTREATVTFVVQPPGGGGPPPEPPLLTGVQPLTIVRDLSPAIDAAETADLHTIVGSEGMTMVVQSLRFFDPEDPNGYGRPVWIRRVDRTEDPRVYRLEIEDNEPGPTWLRAVDGSGAMFNSVLAGDRAGIRYTLDVVLEYGSAGAGSLRPISRFAVGLSDNNAGPIGRVARLWNQYRSGNALAAVKKLPLRELENLLRDKREEPLAATLAGLMLLRTGQLELMHDWPRNLADFFPERPDGAVIRAGQLLQSRRTRENVAEATEMLIGLERTGMLPHTAEAFGRLDAQLQTLTALQRDDQEVSGSLQRLHERVRVLEPAFRSGGLFVTFVTDQDDTSPRELVRLVRPMMVQ
jgi:hypothetical protein